MYATQDQLQIIRQTCLEFGVSKCYLYGSQLKGNATDQSDFDLMIQTFPFWRLMISNFLSTLKNRLNTRVDLIVAEHPNLVYGFDKIVRIV